MQIPSGARAVIIGGGVVGLAAARICMGMGARVTILERSVDRMIYLDDVFNGRIQHAGGRIKI